MRVVDKYYKVSELAVLLSCSRQTVMRRIKSGAFGVVVNIGGDGAATDYRVSASGVNNYLQVDGVEVGNTFGIAARCVGELKRKATSVEEGRQL